MSHLDVVFSFKINVKLDKLTHAAKSSLQDADLVSWV